MLSLEDWHQRYQQQASWTHETRKYLFEHVGFDRQQLVLEVGCGTGAVLADLSSGAERVTVGLDIDLPSLRFFQKKISYALPVAADGLSLPFRSGTFDLVFCHFFLLWVQDPLLALKEMRRVTRPGGSIVALAEPDYGGRIDYPQPLEVVGELQRSALVKQGADPMMGRKLLAFFHQAEIQQAQAMLMGGFWGQPWDHEAHRLEWQVLRSDLRDKLPAEKIDRLEEIDQVAAQNGNRILFVPTFACWGKAPAE